MFISFVCTNSKMDLYYLWRAFFYLVLRVFFSEIEVIGGENIPKDGPVIFVGMLCSCLPV